VNELDLAISLPHGLTGYIMLREVSDHMAKLVGEYHAHTRTLGCTPRLSICRR
jgi:hypothetical protein